MVWICFGIACAGSAGPSPARPGPAEPTELSAETAAAHAELVGCLDEIASQGSTDVVAACVGELHRRPQCRAAWGAAATRFDMRAVASIAAACAGEYCPDLAASAAPHLCGVDLTELPDSPLLVISLAELEGVVLAAEVDLASAPGLLARLAATLVAIVAVDRQEMSVELPGAATAEPAPALVVTLPASGPALLGARMVSDDELAAGLRERVAAGADLRVVVRADDSVSYARVVEVLDIIKTAGVSSFALAVE